MYTNLVQTIEQHDTIIVIGHIYPDGDCYGTQMGLKYLLSQRYPDKKVFVVGSGFPSVFDVLGKPDVLQDEVFQGALALCVDTGDMDRLEDPRFRLAKTRFKIDHHVDTYPFDGDTLVLTNRIAAAEIVAQMAHALGWKIPEKAAFALLLGIITDSNRFLYDLVKEETFVTVSQLLKTGVDLQAIYSRIYKTSLSTFKIKEFVYAHTQKHDKGILYCVFQKTDLHTLGLTPIQAIAHVNMLSNIEGYPIWLMAAEDENKVHIEIRSAQAEVQSLAVSYGGGGHLKASGFRIPSLNHLPEVMEKIKVQ